MAGLLGQGWEDPKSQAIMALSGGLLQGNFGAGLLGANNAVIEAKNNAAKQKYVDMQMQNMQSEIEARKLKTIQDQRQQELIGSVFGGMGSPGAAPSVMGGPGGAPTAVPGAGGSPAPGGVPTTATPAQVKGVLSQLTPDHIARLKLGGIDLTEIYKYANEPLKLEQGSTYVDRTTKQERFMPKLPEGMAPGAGGQYGYVPGYQSSVVGLEADKTRATEAAKAGQDLVKVVGADGAERYVTRAQAVSATQPPASRPAPVSPAAPRGAFEGDPQVVLAAINDIKDPAERSRATQAYEQQYGPLRATPTTAQKLSAEAGGDINKSWIKSSYEPTLLAGQASRDLLDTVQVTRQAMDNMGKTGWGTQTQAAGAAVLSGLGIAPQNAKMFAANAELFQSKAMDRLQITLNAATGPQTEGDADRASKTYASLKNTPQANAFILDMAEAKAQRDQMKARFYQEAQPIARQKGDLSEVDREWARRAPSIFTMPTMKRWTGGIK